MELKIKTDEKTTKIVELKESTDGVEIYIDDALVTAFNNNGTVNMWTEHGTDMIFEGKWKI